MDFSLIEEQSDLDDLPSFLKENESKEFNSYLDHSSSSSNSVTKETIEIISNDLKVNQEMALQLHRNREEFEKYKKSELIKLQQYKEISHEHPIDNNYKKELEMLKEEMKRNEDKFKAIIMDFQKEIHALKSSDYKQTIIQPSSSPSPSPSLSQPNQSNETTSVWNKFNFQSIKNIHDYEKEEIFPNGHHKRSFANGITITFYSNGTAKEMLPLKNTSVEDVIEDTLLGHIFYYFSNGHIKEIFPNGDVLYRYHPCNITCHVHAMDGKRVYSFPSGQVENYYKSPIPSSISNGNNITGDFIYHEIIYPDGTIRQRFSSGREIIKYTDSTLVYLDSSGKKTITIPNGPGNYIPHPYQKPSDIN